MGVGQAKTNVFVPSAASYHKNQTLCLLSDCLYFFCVDNQNEQQCRFSVCLNDVLHNRLVYKSNFNTQECSSNNKFERGMKRGYSNQNETKHLNTYTHTQNTDKNLIRFRFNKYRVNEKFYSLKLI